MSSKSIWSTPVTSNTVDAREPLGAVRKEWNTTDSCFKTYKYVRASMATSLSAGANGTVYGWNDVLGKVVTSDITFSNINQPAGVGVGVLTNQYYGWIQVGGYHSAVKTDAGDDIADGDSIIVHASTDGVCDTTTSGTAAVSKPIGIAVADDVNASDTVAALLCCGYGDIVQ